MKFALLKCFFIFLVTLAGTSCNKSSPIVYQNPITPVFAKGADVGWLSQMEHDGVLFYDSAGMQQDCMQLLKSKGCNSIRLRVWVNPVSGWCNVADVIVQATRAKNLNMRVMIDLHYSDTWADPAHQSKPVAWQSLDFPGLMAAVTDHTKSVMQQLKNAGITPEWTQVGNETNDGMLWNDGKASLHMSQFAALIDAGYNAVKSVSKTTKVIVHISNGFDNALFRWIFDGLKSNHAHWDVIGMSLYPDVSTWTATVAQCLNNMNDMISRYGKEIMICEVGMPADQSLVCKDFLSDIIAKVRSIPGNRGLGVFYWEPESYNSWQGYGLGAFDNTGRPTTALEAFHE